MSENQYYQRFQVARRIEHVVLILSFTTLALTGLPQKFPTLGISDFIVGIFGGIEAARIIHRIAAIIFILQSVYHFLVAGYKIFVLREKATMAPGIKDVKDAFHAFFHNLGIAKTAPKMGRYNFAEKMEYWALVWGLVLMGLTGLMMWNPIGTTNLGLPGEIIPAAKIAHGLEAIMAVAAIIIWHFYHVHIRRWNNSMINGKLSMEEMEEEHVLELEEAVKHPYVPPTAKQKQQRTIIYTPVAVVLGLLSLFAVYQVAYSEQSSITTLPPQERTVVVYVPQTPTPKPTEAPTPTPAPSTGTAWNDGLNAVFAKCTTCHGSLGGLSLESYAGVLAGGKSGAAIIPGDSAASPLVLKVEGGHQKSVWTTEDFQRVKAWIDAGAPETAGGQTSGPVTWDNRAGAIIGKCSACHGRSGSLSLKTYADAMKGGASGAAILPGDAAGSLLIQKVEGGHQSNKWTAEELQIIKDWIQAGALEK
ncbi:MAG TPA: c-type cytochrome domain-containing protein [Anaerolineaceae bacterium]|nr:c-type cytochrome domain-containing protein [Anaerolineaceae bacterium]